MVVVVVVVLVVVLAAQVAHGRVLDSRFVVEASLWCLVAHWDVCPQSSPM